MALRLFAMLFCFAAIGHDCAKIDDKVESPQASDQQLKMDTVMHDPWQHAIILKSGASSWKETKGWCMRCDGKDQKSGVKRIKGWWGTAPSCLWECKKYAKKWGHTKGCEWKSGNSHLGECWIHTKPVSKGSWTKNDGDTKYRCWAKSEDNCEDVLFVLNAWSSSIWNDNKDVWGPQLAWDEDSKIFHSKLEDKPWLRIQLNRPTTITSATIVNRKDCCGERLKNLELRGGMSNDLTNPVIGQFMGPGTTGGRHEIVLNNPTKVLYLSFQLKDNGGILQIDGIKLKKSVKVYKAGKKGTVECPEGFTLVTDIGECEGEARKRFGKSLYERGCLTFGAVGCVLKTRMHGGVYFNTCKGKRTSSNYKPICRQAASQASQACRPTRGPKAGEQCVFPFKNGVYKAGNSGTVECPEDFTLVTDIGECEGEARKRFGKPLHYRGCWSFGVVGCVLKRNGVFFNTCKGKRTSSNYKPICRQAAPEEVKGEPFVLNGGDCWGACGSKGGPCTEACGNGGYCCRKGWSEKDKCPAAMAAIAPNHHTCIQTKKGDELLTEIEEAEFEQMRDEQITKEE